MHSPGTFYAQTVCAIRHALETGFRATACFEEFLPSKTAVLPCKFGHSLDMGFPCFYELPKEES